MCWNATSSLSAFVSGIIICIIIASLSIKEKKYELTALSLGWIWVIFMQFWEYFVWKYPNNIFFQKMTFLFNLSQICVLGLIFLTFFNNQNLIRRGLAFIIIFFYICFFIYFTDSPKITKKSGHLEYNWWNNIPFSGLIYIISLFALFLLLIQPFWWSFITICYILILLLISSLFYSKSVASMWCFFAVSVPLFSYLISLGIY